METKETVFSKKKIIFIIVTVIVLLLVIGVNVYSILFNNKSIETSISEANNFEVEDQILEELPEIQLDEKIIKEKEEQEDKNVNSKSTIIDNVSDAPYYLKVNKSANTITIYSKDSEGNYTVPVKAMICSTGRGTPSSGKYKIPGRKSRWRMLFGNVYGQYVTNIVGSILFHSVPYLDTDPATLKYREYDKLGTTASMGCIRLTVSDAKWIYDNVSEGTTVEFYSDVNPGPLGKPSAQKISSNEECRNWDPTDYTDGNPWFNIKSNELIIENEENNDNQSSIENELNDQINEDNEEKNDIGIEVENEMNKEITNEQTDMQTDNEDEKETNTAIEQESNEEGDTNNTENENNDNLDNNENEEIQT